MTDEEKLKLYQQKMKDIGNSEYWKNLKEVYSQRVIDLLKDVDEIKADIE